MRWLGPVAVFCAATPLPAQTVTGTVTDESGNALRGAFVRLIDGADRQRTATLTDTAGTYTLRAPVAGEYSVQADQIGFHAARLGAITLRAGEQQRVDILLRPNAFTLEAINAEAQSRCASRPGGSADTQLLWDEARKALDIAAWGDERAAFVFELTTSRRTLDRRGVPTRAAPDDSVTATATRPFETLPAVELVSRGFIQPQGNGSFMFYAPDAQVLLSEEFLSTHCFHTVRGRTDRHRGMVGLAFAPLPDRRTPDIEGVLWLDAETRELRTLEFAFRRLPWGQPDGAASGSVDFQRLRTGAWIIRRWSIRIPRMEERPPTLAAPHRRDIYMVGYEEATGVVVSHAPPP